jgi:ATP-dependent Lhr-like helicase
MRLPIKLETRTTRRPPAASASASRRHNIILLTTPEQIALMLSHRDASTLNASPPTVTAW